MFDPGDFLGELITGLLPEKAAWVLAGLCLLPVAVWVGFMLLS